jgi:hypothetical protein
MSWPLRLRSVIVRPRAGMSVTSRAASMAAISGTVVLEETVIRIRGLALGACARTSPPRASIATTVP